MDKRFKRILDLILEETGKVRCSPAEYREGLELIIKELEMAVQASKEMHSDEGVE